MTLEAAGLTVMLGPHAALDRLSFALAPGRTLGVVGESGAGKSMIGRAIAGALPPGFAQTSGSLLFEGRPLPPNRRPLLGRQIAYIPQEPMAALNPLLTIGRQMGEHLRRLGGGDAQALLEAVRLPEPARLLTRYPHQLSGGMCQRVLIAMAFAGAPRLVIADEPTTALDATVQAQAVRLMRELQARAGSAVLFITHDLRLAGEVSDDLLVLYGGRMAELGPAARVLARPRHPYTRCLQLAAPSLRGPRRALFQLGGQMPGVRERTPGCRFAPRCPSARPDCAVAPPFVDGAACHHRDLIPARPTEAPAAPAPGPPLLTATDLGRTYVVRRRFQRHAAVAVERARFVVGEGEFVGLVGESGSGKSTLARLAMGLERPTAGAIAFEGPPRARQMVFQDPASALNPRRTVADIVTQRLRAEGAGSAARRARAAELLPMVGLAPEIAARYPAQLSGGQRQRVNIARALCIVPRLLVADEIVSGLDVSVQAQLLHLLLRLRAELGFAMLLISHDLAVVRQVCSRVLVMQAGRIVEQGATEAVFAAPAHSCTRALLAAADLGPPIDALAG